MEITDPPIRRDASFPFSGRLIAMPTTRSLRFDEGITLSNELSIDFPAMPDTIELIRAADYNVSVPINLADGVHQFKGTRPLEIPFSFRIHAFDQQYCPNGALTLLQLAARLHSFVAPIDTGQKAIPAKAGKTASNSDPALEKNAAAPDGGAEMVSVIGNKIAPPVTCRLELIFTTQNGPGIACTGYVREVSAKLNGPWMRGPGKSANLPSSGDFSFVFVHHPGHGNSGIGDPGDIFAQAYANVVKDRFYNTRQLAKSSSYQGLVDPPPVFESTDSPPASPREIFQSVDSPPAPPRPARIR
jgi:hypothetical protein